MCGPVMMSHDEFVVPVGVLCVAVLTCGAPVALVLLDPVWEPPIGAFCWCAGDALEISLLLCLALRCREDLDRDGEFEFDSVRCMEGFSV
jgi:hypothetical protein